MLLDFDLRNGQEYPIFDNNRPRTTIVNRSKADAGEVESLDKIQSIYSVLDILPSEE